MEPDGLTTHSGGSEPPPGDEAAWHRREVADVIRALGTDRAQGLRPEEAARRLRVYGPNVIVEGRRRGSLRMLLAQFADFMVLILLASAVVAASGAAVALGASDDAGSGTGPPAGDDAQPHRASAWLTNSSRRRRITARARSSRGIDLARYASRAPRASLC